MKREKQLAFEQGIADTRNRFHEWRKNRKNRREPIPTNLLDLAAVQCRKFPYTKVAKALNINPGTLKTRISSDIPPGIKKAPDELDFVEMKIQQQTTGFISQSPACEILIACREGHSIKIAFANMPPNSLIFQVLNTFI
jgi:hypothetical protein